jgi:hypothetical protein
VADADRVSAGVPARRPLWAVGVTTAFMRGKSITCDFSVRISVPVSEAGIRSPATCRVRALGRQLSIVDPPAEKVQRGGNTRRRSYRHPPRHASCLLQHASLLRGDGHPRPLVPFSPARSRRRTTATHLCRRAQPAARARVLPAYPNACTTASPPGRTARRLPSGCRQRSSADRRRCGRTPQSLP